jgi:DNA-binding transcriptional ArsR family regulator
MRSAAPPETEQAVAARLARAINEATKYPRGKSDAGATLDEIAEQMGMSRSYVSIHLKQLFKVGKVKVGHRLGEDVTGRARWVPVYSVREEGSNGR